VNASSDPAPRQPVAYATLCIAYLLILASLAIGLLAYGGEIRPDNDLPTRSSDLFIPTKVWTIHLRFTPDQWAAIEPKDRRQGPSAPQPFGTGMILAPAMFRAADDNHDRILSPAEFHALGVRWFNAWDHEQNGTLEPSQVRDGLKSILTASEPDDGSMGFSLLAEPGRRNGVSSVLLGLDFEYVHADLEFEGTSFPNVAVRYKGNGTFMEARDSLKRSFKIDLNKHVKGQKLAGLTTLNLHNNVTDAGMMNEVLSHELYRDFHVPAPRTAYARVSVTVPGLHDRKDFGLYSLVENVDKNFLADHDLARASAILKPSTPSVFTDLGNDWTAYNQIYDPKTDLSETEKQRVIDLCRLVSHADDAEFAARLPDFIDLDEFARFLAVTVWTGDLDSILTMGQNYYLLLDPDSGRFQFVPWDRDHSFGAFGGRDYAERVHHSVRQPWQGRKRFLERAFQVDAFRDLYLAAITQFAREQALPDRIHHRVEEIGAAIRPAVAEESPKMLDRFDRVVAGKPLPPSGMFGFGAPTPTLLAFVNHRAAAVNDQLAGKSDGQVLGTPRPGDRPPPEFHPEAMVEPPFTTALDANKDRKIDRNEFLNGFDTWFTTWTNGDEPAPLTESRLREGLNQSLPFRFGFGFGAPPPGNEPPAPPRNP
jgi:hypothetical protein